MRQQGDGSILFNGASAWVKGFANSSVYESSKRPLNSNIGIILKTSASKGMYIAKYSEFPNEMEFLSGGDVFVTNIEKIEKRYIFTVEFVKWKYY